MQDLQLPQAQPTYDLNLALPNLFLVVKSFRPMLPGREWYHIQHQCAGIGCRQKSFYGTPIIPRGKIALGLAQISEHFYDSSMGCMGTSFDDVAEYRGMLKDLGLDCQWSYPELAEAYYPIDLPHNLDDFLEDEELPAELDDLIDWQAEGNDGPLHRLAGIIGRWSLVWLSENSD